MSEQYDKNGYGGSDFKRMKQDQNDENEESLQGNEKTQQYVRDLLVEKADIDPSKNPLITRILDSELTKVQATGRVPYHETRFYDVFRDKPVKVVVKISVPIKEFPKFNFVGKLLGPKGNTLKGLQEETMCKMAVLGRGSMRDKQKEEELRSGGDLKYAHLNEDLHVEISALGPPAEAHARIAYALAEVRKYLTPEPNDNIRQEQFREMVDRGGMPPPNVGRPPQRPALMPRPSQAPPRAITTSIPPGGPHGMGGPGGPRNKTAKVMSILDRARSAMEDPYYHQEPPSYQEPQQREEFYYERRQPQYYEEPEYNAPPPPPHFDRRDNTRDYAPKISSREVGSRRAPQGGGNRGYRTAPYDRPHK